MATEIRHLPLSTSTPHVPMASRLLGLGSVFGKTVRDSRIPGIVVAALLGVMVAAGGAVMADTYGTAAARAELAAMSSDMPPMLRGMYGNPVNVDTLGGFISWHYGTYFALLAGLWSILALSSILAGEARRGSLDLTVATAQPRRAIALQKLAGHAMAVAVVAAFVGVVAWATGAFAATFPGDAIDPGAAAAFALGIAVRALVAGSVAFAPAPLLGRGAAAGIAGALMLGGYVVHSYRTVVPAFDAIAGATWFSWTADHVPLAGRTDWAGIGLAAVATLALLAVGIEAFARRDVGVTFALPGPRVPRVLLGVHGPLGRSLGDLLPGALAWGAGLGAYGLLMAAASGSLLDMLKGSPAMEDIFRRFIPGIDITTTAGFLQLAFADLGFVLIALAATTFIAARSSDETAGRLELQLTTPLTRARWAAASGIATWLAIALVTGFLGAAIGLGVLSTGQDPVMPVAGTLVLLAYGAAAAGVGIAVGGLWRASLAMPAVLALAVGTFLLDTLAPILRFPDWVAQLALTSHLGEPMIGTWDMAGMVACLVLAVGGLGIGAWGMSQRDVGT
jgi:polyether ionophore transport system permease protein